MINLAKCASVETVSVMSRFDGFSKIEDNRQIIMLTQGSS
jgi:hypothetical protein